MFLGPSESKSNFMERESCEYGILRAWAQPFTYLSLVTLALVYSFPLIAAVTFSNDELYSWVSEKCQWYIAAVLPLTAVILLAMGFVAQRAKRLAETSQAMQRAQEKLRRSEERYRLVESAVSDGIWDEDLVTGKIYLSPRWKTILSRADNELPNTWSTFLELVHPEDRSAVDAMRREYLETDVGEAWTIEYRLRRGDGSYCWIRSRGSVLRDADNKPVRRLGTSTDISERQRARDEIDENRDNLARAETMALMGHYKIDFASGRYDWSEGLYRIMGKSPASFAPTLQGVLDLIHPDDRAILERYRRDIAAGLDPGPITKRVVKGDGQIIYIECWSVPVRAGDGAVSGMFGTIQDVTARKLAEAELQRTRAFLDAVIANMPVMLTVKDARDKTYVLVNKESEKLFKVPAAQFVGKRARDVVAPEQAVLFEERDRKALNERKLVSFEHDVAAANGIMRRVRAIKVPIPGDDGEPQYIITLSEDITERKQAEDELARANLELERRVAERTAELGEEMRKRENAQMTLAQAQKMEAVGQLTAGIAHDFNNLLAVIQGSLGFVEGAAARGVTAEPELIDAALRAARRGRELIQRLLAFARQAPLQAEPTPIDQLVLDTLRLLQRTLGGGIDIVTLPDAPKAAALIDRNGMANALMNLALNARDAMPEGGQLTIETKCEPARWAAAEGSSRWPTGEAICIAVSDTGAGMTEEVRNRAFEPFFTTKRDGLGSGLGLSMVLGFVEQSGGHIEIDSAVGRGTTIMVHLPRIESSCGIDESYDGASTHEANRGKTVLLVEDDPDVRLVTAAQLKELGYRVRAVASGNEAIDLIESPASIDIMLTDMILPGGIDGLTLLREAMRARPGIGVLCMSGYDPSQNHRQWFKIQNIEFLEKPFSRVRLAQAFQAVLAA
jgi:PAS domain S-box-containing protein